MDKQFMVPNHNDTKIILRKLPEHNPKEELKKNVIKSLFNFINMDMENHKEFEKLNSIQQTSNNKIQININLNIEVKINKQQKKKPFENLENHTKTMEEKIELGFKINQNQNSYNHIPRQKKIYETITHIKKPPTILLKKPQNYYDNEIPIINFKKPSEKNKIQDYKPKVMKIMHINKSMEHKSIEEKKVSLQSSLSENEEIEIRSEIIEPKNNLIMDQENEENNKPIYELDAYFYYLVGKIGTYWKGASKTCPNPFKKKMFFNEANDEDDKMIEIFDLSHKFIPDFKQTF